MGAKHTKNRKSSNKYMCTIYDIDFSKRQFRATLTPTGASDYSLPDSGHEALFLTVLWETGRFEDELLTEEDKMIKNSVGSINYNGIDISKFKYDRKQKGLKGKIGDAWRKLSDEEKQPYIDYSNNRKREQNLLARKLIKEQKLPPLAELSVDDITNDIGTNAWKYIQKVIDENEPKKRDVIQSTSEEVKKPTGSYTVIVTDPKWLIGVRNARKGTVARKGALGEITWTKELHHYFPVSFRERTKTLLMMRLPRHAPNPIGMLPEPLFLLILQYLAVMTYEEDRVEPWEIKLRSKNTKRILEIHECAMEEQKRPRR